MADATEDMNVGSVVSDDHADESLCAQGMASSQRQVKAFPRLITADEVKAHNNSDGSFWAVVDSFVVDATEFVKSHPGGVRKLLAADSASSGATGQPFSFSFSRGRNAHFPDTGKKFKEGVKQYLSGTASTDNRLPPYDVNFPPYGKVVILGRLEGA